MAPGFRHVQWFTNYDHKLIHLHNYIVFCAITSNMVIKVIKI